MIQTASRLQNHEQVDVFSQVQVTGFVDRIGNPDVSASLPL